MEQSNLTPPLASISSTNNEYRQQLLILGNGFDLACGLDSTYNDFFDFIFRKGWTNNYWYDIFETLSNDNSLTTNNWSDIETRILLELQNIEFLYEKKIFQIGNYLDRENQIEDEINDYFSNNSENIFFKPTSIIKTTQTIMNRFEKLPPISIVQEELINDLSTVEFDFCSFLEYQIKIAENEKDTPFQFHKNRHEKYSEYYKKSILLVSYIIRHYSGVEGSLDKLYDIIDSIPTLSSFDELKKG